MTLEMIRARCEDFVNQAIEEGDEARAEKLLALRDRLAEKDCLSNRKLTQSKTVFYFCVREEGGVKVQTNAVLFSKLFKPFCHIEESFSVHLARGAVLKKRFADLIILFHNYSPR